jgi:hypothetical protein
MESLGYVGAARVKSKLGVGFLKAPLCSVLHKMKAGFKQARE